MKNEILEEVWVNRDKFAKEHHYDLDKIVSSLQEMEKHPLSTVVDRREGAPNKSLNPNP